MHRPSGYFVVTCCSFDKSKNESYYGGKDCMKIFWEGLKDEAMKIINYEKKETMPLTNERIESYENHEIYHTCEKEFCAD